MNDEWITAREVAAMYRLKIPTIRLWARQGMPSLRLGRLVRFRMSQVHAWITQQKAKRPRNTKRAK
jgi:excisionase family DNA binding protein